MGTGNFIPSIDVDSCIIEEQADHLVIAIRVPKATVAANLAMFSAMADRCGAGRNARPYPPQAPPVITARWRQAALVTFVAAASIIAIPPIAWSAGQTILDRIHHIF